MHKSFQHTTPGFSDPDQKPTIKAGLFGWGRGIISHINVLDLPVRCAH